MAVPLLGNGLMIALWAQLFFIPAGSSIRPMGPALLTLVLGLLTGVVGVGFSCVLFGRRRFAGGVLCLLTSLCPIPVFVVMVRLAMLLRGITLAD